MNETLFTEYAEICAKIKELEDKKKAMSEEVYSHMQELHLEQLKSLFGTFSLASRSTWKFSNEWKMQKEELGFIEEEEKKNGKATEEKNFFVRFQGLKEVKE